MNRPRAIPHDVRQAQIEASDPAVSAWVAANAGSGKTYVLAQRVIRLMLDGTDPAKILCLTFTKAAAANMANQIFGILAEWVALEDGALEAAIEAIEGKAPEPSRRARARRLFANALETPGGLKVQTIHAFCVRLLHQFPFEADTAVRFTVLEERAENDLLERLRLQVLLDAAAAPDSPLGRALSKAIATAADQTLGEAIAEAIEKRDALAAWIGRTGTVEAAVAELSALLGIASDDSIERIETEFTHGPDLPAIAWERAADALADGATSDRQQAQRLMRAARSSGDARIEAYLSVFLTDRREPRLRLVTKPFERRHPDLAARLHAERDRLTALIARRQAIAARDRTSALVTIADAVLRRYRAEKDRRGLLDYDDLIDKTLALMEKVEAAWVHYKLDLGVDHLLIDEAQDTSPKQWEIVKKLTAEFTSGEGARGALTRSIFAVGDEKQSIFSFQGAAPGTFGEARMHFRRVHRESEIEFVAHRFAHSFRSGGNVLGAVDAVFAKRQVFESVTTDAEGVPPHIALPDTPPGSVEIWPLVKAEKRREVDGWDAPFDEVSEISPQVKLAERIATRIGALTKRGRSAGDILVLVRQRGPLFEAIIRTLKNAGIPVAGADRLVLTEHIAVMDLMVLADALLLPDDDLALATILKSPLFGFDDEHLFDLAYNRASSLRATLRIKAGENPRFAETAARLDRLAEAARRETPFAFYARLLGAEDGRRKMLARLGTEAADAIDEFLNVALDYEAYETPSLQGFVAWLRAARTEVKRDMDIVRDEVRVMTVHGAKGLEAPIVILADTTTRPTGPRDPRLFALPRPGAPPGTPDCLVWGGPSAADVGPIAAARERARRDAENEHRRLLYVGMTRAAHRLLVCGTQGLNGKPAGCWYDLICDALWAQATEEPAEPGCVPVRRWRVAASEGPDMPEWTHRTDETSPLVLPEWLTHEAPADLPNSRVVSPSTADNLKAVPPTVGAGEKQRAALARGRIAHRLLQLLPDIAPDRRVEAARRHLARTGGDFSEAEREAIRGEVLAVLADPVFAPLFVPGTRAEIPIVGRIRRNGKASLVVSGQVDRLAITPEAVLMVDYKTNRPAPRRIEDVPRSYIAQLALYRAVLRQIYPDRQVRTALVWTDVPDLVELPDALLDAALGALP